jgi:CheY-like chemotaxis protein
MQGIEKTSWKRRSDPPHSLDESRDSAVRGEPVRILIVDSDIKLSNSLELALHASGYSETRVAYSGHAALALAAEFQPSLVLLALDLLDMSGYEVARLLREHAQTRDMRLIALTPSHEHAGRELARAAGFERYLLKPIVAFDLQGVMQEGGDRVR